MHGNECIIDVKYYYLIRKVMIIYMSNVIDLDVSHDSNGMFNYLPITYIQTELDEIASDKNERLASWQERHSCSITLRSRSSPR